MKTKKWRDVKNALVMVVVMAAMMSTATYAWFTLTSNATVTGMQMTAGGSSGLKVSTDNANWYDAVSLEQLDAETGDPIKQVVNQVTIKDADKIDTGVYSPTFYKPSYGTTQEDGKNGVVSVTPIYEANEPLTDYMAKYTYYLKTEADSDATVGIVVAPVPGSTQNTGVENGAPLIDGSFVREVGTSSANTAARAVRVGIVVDGKMYVYEPNNGASNTGNDAPTDYTGTYTSSIISDTSGKISATSALGEKSGVADVTGYDVSKGLFTVSNTGKEVTMYVWLEGTDEDCVNEIKADDIEAQIQFTIVEQN